MKKILSVLLVAVAFALPAGAQVTFGITGGVNMSNVSVKDIPGSVRSRTGFFVGPIVNFTLPVVGLSADIAALYDQREGNGEDATATESVTIKAQSIQFPINVRYGWGLGSVAELFLFAGPQFGFNVGSSKKLKDVANEVSEWSLKSSNVSANVGLGVMVANHLLAKFNYNIAFGKTGEFKVNDATVGHAKFNSWQLSLAYLF